ncbi:MAG: hypothetical protein GXZ08_05955 [Tissierellia bacterium]|nr:hypothetical protein [Tissierellia bacterium]
MKALKFQFIEKTNKDVYIIGIVDSDKLVEITIFDNSHESKVGNIYRGRVINIVKGLKAAFVNIGLKSNAYLYLGDDRLEEINEGEQVIVQVSKDEFDQKGAKVTTEYSLRGNHIVLMPFNSDIKLSKKIKSIDRRRELFTLAKENSNGFGLILRTSSEFAPEEDILKELNCLIEEFNRIEDSRNFIPTPKLVRAKEGNREISINADVDYVITNDNELYQKIKQTNHGDRAKYDGRFSIRYSEKLYTTFKSLFDKKIELPNGAQIVIENTEAMNVIDVNSKKYFDDYDLNKTILNTNKSAAEEILKQIALRDLSGIIIIDFIDFIDLNEKKEFLEWFTEESKLYNNAPNILGFTKLGLMEMTRRRSINSQFIKERKIDDLW